VGTEGAPDHHQATSAVVNATYAGTLLHEVAHAVSGTPDISAGFEDAVTAEIGTVTNGALDR
jgi:hypothetical protein